ncbi:hypothetical protein DID88_001707 [Monilinia fructigena]|uniref:Uncharacterized protein n=1 Tax=Monilinia fructigena TaxID=38457 RepID=A0A395IXR6_9HELO|nr:hypothetical protein DID88_001707 [Monilinia fructigena]
MSPPRKLLEKVRAEEDIIEEREEHEPFNGQLWEKAKGLAVREEELVEQIAALRRGVPGTVTEREGKWKVGVEEDEAKIEELRVKLSEVDDVEQVGLGLEYNERQAVVEKDWEKGLLG